VSRGGTNFSNAFYEAVAILGPMTYSPKLLFLLTDGEDLEGDAAQRREAGQGRRYSNCPNRHRHRGGPLDLS
jgi:hypothetical protein